MACRTHSLIAKSAAVASVCIAIAVTAPTFASATQKRSTTPTTSATPHHRNINRDLGESGTSDGVSTVTTLAIVTTSTAESANAILGSTKNFAAAKKHLEEAASQRETRLARLVTAVNTSTTLTSTDKTALGATLEAETRSLEGLATRIPSDTTVAELKKDAVSLYEDDCAYRVIGPQVAETIVADAEIDELAKLATQGPFTANLTSLITKLQTRLGFVHSSLLVQTAAGYPANAKVFAVAKTALSNADREINLIAEHIRQAKGASGASGPSGSLGSS